MPPSPRRVAPLPLALSLAACATAPGAPAALGEDALRAALSGASFACREADAAWTAAFAADGGYAYVLDGQRFAGRWRLAGGDRLCTRDSGWPEEQCYGAAKAGRSLLLTRDEGGAIACDPA